MGHFIGLEYFSHIFETTGITGWLLSATKKPGLMRSLFVKVYLLGKVGKENGLTKLTSLIKVFNVTASVT
jgi:hypothetical protein